MSSPPHPAKAWALEEPVSGSACFAPVLHPSLFFCRSLCCQEIPLPSLLGDAVLDCGPPTSDLLPTDMCTSFSDCTYMTAVPVVLSVMLTPTPPVGLLPPHMQAQVVQHYSFHLVVYKPQVWQHERTHRCCISMNTCSGYTIRLFTFFCKTFIPVRVSSYIIQYLLYTHKNMALPYFLCCQEICRILLWPCMIHFFCVSSPRPTTRRNQLTVTCGKLLWAEDVKKKVFLNVQYAKPPFLGCFLHRNYLNY